MMSLEKEFRQGVRRHLEVLSPGLITVLAQLIGYDYPQEVVSIEFEVFPDQFASGFPVRAFFMDANNCEYFVYEDGKAVYPSPVDPGLIDIVGVYPEEFEDGFVGRDENLNTFKLASRELIEWFSRCWEAAGGERFARRAAIMCHDDVRAFNLKSRSWESL